MSKRKRKLAAKGDAPSIATSLRNWRKYMGFTRKQAAEHLGINVRTLESWEYGYRSPPSLHLTDKLWGTKRRDP